MSGATGCPSRVTYLMEPLKVLEIDAGGGEVQIRSQSPTARRRRARLLRNAALPPGHACAWSGSRSTRRRASGGESPCQLTREVLERLADDIAASLV